MPDKKITIVKKTKKTGSEIILPGTNTTIYQSNRITNGRYKGFTLIQSKLFIALIKQLQAAIKLDMEGKSWGQLNLFDSVDKRLFKIGIPLSEIGKPNQYGEIADSATAFTTLNIRIKPLEGYDSIATLAARIDLPKKESGRTVLYIYMLREVGEQLIIMDKNTRGGPEKYTNYLYEVAMGSKNKYTPKLYWIISSWKNKGGFKMQYETLREQLGVDPGEYAEYSDFKKRVLIPAQQELEKKANCWFNCSDKEFEERVGKKVVTLNFKVITPVFEEEQSIKVDNIKHLLRLHAGFTDKHIEKVTPIFKSGVDYQAVQLKLLELTTYLKDSKGKDSKGNLITDIAGWTCICLLNEFEKE